MTRSAPLLLLLLLLAGCATRTVPPATVYTLDPDIDLEGVSAEAHRGSGPTLKLAPIRGARPFATTRMLYSRGSFEQNSFAFSRWNDSPVALLQLLFSEGLNRSGLFKAVLPPGTSIRSDLVLEGTLLDFSLHVEREESAAVMEIRFLLLDGRRREVLASRLFRARIPVEQASPEATAGALNGATREILLELIHWLQEQPALAS